MVDVSSKKSHKIYLQAASAAFLFIIIGVVAVAQCHGAVSALVAFSIYYWNIATVFLMVYYRRQGVDIFSPLIGFVVLAYLYSVASAMDVETTGMTIYGDPISSRTLTVYYVSCLVGLSGLAFGIIRSAPPRGGGGRRLSNNRLIRQVMFILALAAVAVFGRNIISFFDLTAVKSYAETALESRMVKLADSSAGITDVFSQEIPVTLVLSVAIVAAFGKNIFFRAAGALVFIDYILVRTLSGARGGVFSAVVMAAIYYHYRVFSISLRKAIILALSAYLFMNALPVVRSSSHPMEMVNLLWDFFQKDGVRFLKLASSGELVVGENLMRLIEGISTGQTQFTFGTSIVTEVLVFIPRIFFDQRPLPLSERFVDVFYPGVRETGAGYGFFFLQEGYWAFGVVGVFCFTYFYGWLTQKVYFYFKQNMSSDLAAVAYSGVYYAMVVSSVRSGIIGSCKSALMNSMAFLLVLGCYRFVLGICARKEVR